MKLKDFGNRFHYKTIRNVKYKKEYFEKIKSYSLFLQNIRYKLTQIFPKRCLNYSLTMYKFLNEVGIKTKVHIGVAKSKDIGFHAWITAPELEYVEKNNGYKELYSF